MATTGVPNKLYKGTDAPDLVDGAYATHTHDVSVIQKRISDISRITCLGTQVNAVNNIYFIFGEWWADDSDSSLRISAPDYEGSVTCNMGDVIPRNVAVEVASGVGVGQVSDEDGEFVTSTPIKVSVTEEGGAHVLKFEAAETPSSGGILAVGQIQFTLMVLTNSITG